MSAKPDQSQNGLLGERKMSAKPDQSQKGFYFRLEKEEKRRQAQMQEHVSCKGLCKYSYLFFVYFIFVVQQKKRRQKKTPPHIHNVTVWRDCESSERFVAPLIPNINISFFYFLFMDVSPSKYGHKLVSVLGLTTTL